MSDETKQPSIPVLFVAKNTFRRFSADQCTDLAAGLTYYTVMALFPGLLALVSLLGVFGDPTTTVNSLLDLFHRFAPGTATDQLEPIIRSMVGARGSGWTLALGIVLATWSASGYIGAFSRAMNRLYRVQEGRPVWKLRPTFFALTIVMELCAALVLAALALSGTVAEAVASWIHLGESGLRIWNIAKWPGVVLIVVLMIALLYEITPNVKQPRFRWLTPGAAVAFFVWALGSVGFAFYVTNFGSYNKTYGALAGVIVLLIWLWLTNVALLLGAQLDREVIQARQLLDGRPAEAEAVLPVKDDSGILKTQKKVEKAEAQARELRAEGELAAMNESTS